MKRIQKILEQYIEPILKENESLQAEVQKLQGKIDAMSAELVGSENILKQLSKGHQEQLTWHQEQLTGHQEQLTSHQQQLTGHQDQLDVAWNRLDACQEQLTACQEQFIGHQEQLTGHQQQLTSHQDQLNVIQEQLVACQGQFSGYQEQLNSHQEQFAGHQDQLKGHQEQLNNHHQQINDCHVKIQTLYNVLEILLNKKMNDNAVLQQSLNCAATPYFSLSEYLDDQGQTFSQSGEDAIVAYILQFLQKPISEITYLDLGANHAKKLSNTYLFYYHGARGVLVEANPGLIPELERIRPEDIVLNRAITFDSRTYIDFYILNGDGLSTIDLESAEEACRRNPELSIIGKYAVKSIQIGDILDKYFDKAPTVLSIDLEGIEEQILGQIDYENYAPWIIILENIPYTPLLSAGQREYKCVEFLKQHGYVEYAFTGINSIFIRQAVVEEFNQKRLIELEQEDNRETE